MKTLKQVMNKLRILFVLFSFTFAISCGQQKNYISYKTKQGETLQEIAKRYGISEHQLLKLNPDIDKNLPINTPLILPNKTVSTNTNSVKTEKVAVTKPATATSELDSLFNSKTISTAPNTKITDANALNKENLNVANNEKRMIEKVSVSYKTHTVLPKETVYGLTKKYEMTKDELIKLNPEFLDLKDNKLSIGQVLKVKKVETKKLVPLDEELNSYVTHIIQPKETMYSLTRFYNISKKELVALNTHLPNLKYDMLGIGEELKIRKRTKEDVKAKRLIYKDSINFGKTIHLALLLPFNAKKYDSVAPKEIFKNRLTSSITDFYLGAEMAVDSIKQQGVNVNFNVFDTGHKGKKTPEILTDSTFKKADVVIGPFYTKQAKLVSNSINKTVVFPHFSKNQGDFKAKAMVKASPEVLNYISTLTSYLKNKFNGENIFVVGDGTSLSDRKVSRIVQNLKQHDSIKEVFVLKPENGYIKKERFTDKMKPKSSNWIILTSNDNVAVADALNSFVVLPEDVKAQVFALTKNKAYNNIDNNKLARLELIYVTDDYVDDKDNLTKVFNRKFKAKNYALPSRYATKGFDVTYDILARLSSGEPLDKTFEKGASIRVGNKFDFEKESSGATKNNGLFIVKHNKDLSLTRLQ